MRSPTLQTVFVRAVVRCLASVLALRMVARRDFVRDCLVSTGSYHLLHRWLYDLPNDVELRGHYRKAVARLATSANLTSEPKDSYPLFTQGLQLSPNSWSSGWRLLST